MKVYTEDYSAAVSEWEMRLLFCVSAVTDTLSNGVKTSRHP